MKQIIKGQAPSKSNCYKIVKFGNRSGLSKTPSLKSYEEAFYLQCDKYRNKNITGFFELYLDVYNKSNRQDLDNSFKVILDCLEKCNAIKNDNRCVKIVAQKFVDKDDPRIEFELKEIE